MTDKPRFAVVLSGCGHLDGAEIHESVCTLLAIEKNGAEYQCFAPNADQREVINHMTREPVSESRNMLIEAARIARGRIQDIKELDPDSYDAVIFPGGFGAAKNLSTFATNGADCAVDEDVTRVIRGFHERGKPIGALCIAPAVMAKVLGEVELTIGSDAATASVLESLGATHRTTGHGEITVDQRNKLVTTPCYMLDSTLPQIAEGAENAVKALIDLAAA